MSPVPAAAQPNATKDRILDAAERLFALHGFDGTSMRGITAEAQVNLAAINYHFQSKEALFQAAVARRVTPVNATRLNLLDAYEQSLGEWPPEPEPILEAFMQPVLDVVENQGQHVPMLMVRMQYLENHDTFRPIFEANFRPVVGRFCAVLHRALPHLSQEELLLRMRFILGSFVQMLCGNPAPQLRGNFSRQQAMRSLIQFAAAGLRAPITKEVE